ncbi:MAG: hypothetical protein FJW30_09730 [Acidobacteria bacterium]|nr:hypothetical protein [Acidobacteriota bacterium]
MINNVTAESGTPSAVPIGNVWPRIFALLLNVNQNRRPARVEAGERTESSCRRALKELQR